MQKKISFFVALLIVFVASPSYAVIGSASIKTVCPGWHIYTTCNPGYYLSGSTCVPCAVGTFKSTTGTGACESCPSSGGIAGTTASTGAKAKTECYLPSGTSFSDGTGSGTYTGNCYWKD